MSVLNRVVACALVALAAPVQADPAPLTLDDAFARALRANGVLLERQDRVRFAELDYAATRAVLSPQVQTFMNSDARSGAEMGSTYGLTLDRQLLSGASFGVGYYDSTFSSRGLSELRLHYTLPFFGNRGEELKSSLDDARFAVARENAALRLTVLDVKREVLRRYYDVALAETDLELAQSAAAISARTAEAMRIRHGGGQVSDLDVRRAEIAAAQAAFRGSRATQALTDATNQLKLAIGAPLGEPLAVAADAPPLSGLLLDAELPELVARALDQRPEVAEAERAIDTAERRLLAERATFLPNVEVSLQYSLASESFRGLTAEDDHRFGIGVRMNTDFSRSARSRSSERFALEIEQRRRAQVRAQQVVELDVRRAWDAAFALLDQAALAHEAAELAAAEHERGQVLAAAGRIDLLELSRLELGASEARFQTRAVEVARAAALYDLELAVGGLQ